MSRSLSDAIRAGNVAEVKSSSSDVLGCWAAGLLVVVNQKLWQYLECFIGTYVQLTKYIHEKWATNQDAIKKCIPPAEYIYFKI